MTIYDYFSQKMNGYRIWEYFARYGIVVIVYARR